MSYKHERICRDCRRAMSIRIPGVLCPLCSVTQGKHPTGSAVIPPPSVDPTREERIRYYTARAQANLPLFGEKKYGAEDWRKEVPPDQRHDSADDNADDDTED